MESSRPLQKAASNSVLAELRGGDLRSIGNSNRVVSKAQKDPKLLAVLIEGGMFDIDPVVRARSAEAAEKVARTRHDYLQPFKRTLIDKASKITQQEVRWHLAQMYAYLYLTPRERNKIEKLLFSWLNSDEKSQIVKVFSLQALFFLALQDRQMLPKVRAKLEDLATSGTPSLKSRSRRLLKELEFGNILRS